MRFFDIGQDKNIYFIPHNLNSFTQLFPKLDKNSPKNIERTFDSNTVVLRYFSLTNRG